MTNMMVAVLITTNLMYHPCTGGVPGSICKWCDSEPSLYGSVAKVPEHINRIGYDMDWVVTTNYLPVIEMPIQTEK